MTMTPVQQSALEAVAGRALTPQEIINIDDLLPIRNDVAIAEVITLGKPSVMVSLKVEDVFDTLFSTGDYMTLKMAQLQGNPLALMAFAVLDDAKRIGSGMVNLNATPTAQMMTQLQGAELLSATGYAALVALATVPGEAVNYNAVSDALNIAEGRMTLP